MQRSVALILALIAGIGLVTLSWWMLRSSPMEPRRRVVEPGRRTVEDIDRPAETRAPSATRLPPAERPETKETPRSRADASGRSKFSGRIDVLVRDDSRAALRERIVVSTTDADGEPLRPHLGLDGWGYFQPFVGFDQQWAEAFRVPAGTYRIVGDLFGYRAVDREIEVTAGFGDEQFEIVLEPSWVLKARLIGQDGRPIQGALTAIELTGDEPYFFVATDTPLSGIQPRSLRTRASGQPGPDGWELSIDREPPVWVSALQDTVVLGSVRVNERVDSVDIRVDPAKLESALGSLRLEAWDEVEDRPAAGVFFTIGDDQRRTEPDGALEWRGILPGKHVLTSGDETSRGRTARLITIEPGKELDLGQVVLGQQRTLTVRFSSKDGVQAAPWVVVVPETGQPGDWMGLESSFVETATSSTGELQIPALSPGRYRVVVFDLGIARRASAVDLTDGDRTIALSLSRGTSVALDPIFEKGSRRRVTITAPGQPAVYAERVASTEHVEMMLLPGTYIVKVEDDATGAHVATREVQVADEPLVVTVP
ncbi:MAG: hypothetical protein RL885_01985 [Planctomycetota bacterium]